MITAIIAISSLCSISTMLGLALNAVKEQNEIEQDYLYSQDYNKLYN